MCIVDFSLTHWLNEQDIKLGQSLPQYGVDLLLEELGVAGYLQDTACQRSSYLPDNHGWNMTGKGQSSFLLFTSFNWFIYICKVQIPFPTMHTLHEKKSIL